MKINLFRGRFGQHRFHSMLVHFPSGLYPFSLVVDFLGLVMQDPSLTNAGLYSLLGGLATSCFAILYGIVDFLQIGNKTIAWKKAGIHALLNIGWQLIFSVLLQYRLKYPDVTPGVLYLVTMGIAVSGLFYSNYLGADLVIRHKIGIEDEE